MKKVERVERGWGGHFICADRCMFRRNTLLTCGDRRVIVSSVGLMKSLRGAEEKFEEIGHQRYYETMAFEAQHDGRYWDADVSKEVQFSSPWAIADVDADDRANDMHEAVVSEIISSLRSNKSV